jgi:hypothetical protein
MFVRVRNWVADAAAGIKIRADYHDIEDDGFAAGISQCIARDGQSTILNNIPMNGKRLVSLSDPVDPQDAVTKAYDDLKLPLTGGTITGSLTVNGQVTTTGYKCRAGLSGGYGANWFNFNWGASGMEVYADDYHWGTMATTAYVEQRAQDWAHAIADPKVNRAGDTMGGLLNTAVGGNIGSSGGMNSIWINGNANDWAALTFYSPGAFGANFGLSPNGDFYCGGWSYGAGVAYKFWTTRNLNPILNAQWVNAGTATSDVPNAVVSSLTIIGGTGQFQGLCNGGTWRYLQLLTPGGWYTIGRAS